ncbi:MAG: HepT-like ribonuclease domain-containing protein [Candidatus Anammoxibacter sp.]
MKDDKVYLQYILECIKRIEEDIACGCEIFMDSHLHQDAVLRNLHTLTESTQRISENLKRKHPEIKWKNIAALRNVLVHDYLGIDLDKTWQTASQDVPKLKKSINEILLQID